MVRNCSLLSLLLNLIMGQGVPETVLTEIIITVAECIRGQPESQTDFSSLEAPLTPPRPAMVVLLMSMVNKKQPLALRLAVLYCTASWLHKNSAAQAELIGSLLPSDNAAPPTGVTAGQLLCGALFSTDATTSWLASCVFSHAILNQRDNQDALVRVQLAAAPNQPPISLSSQLDVMLSQAQSPHTRLGILQFLSCWASDSPVVSHVLLQEGKLVATLQLLIDGSPSDPMSVLIHGVASFLLGQLGMYDESVVERIRARPGPDSFLDKLSQVSKAVSYQRAAGNACPQGECDDELQIFHAFTLIYRKHEAAIGRHVAQFEDIRAEMAEKRLKTARIEQLEQLLGEREARIVELESREPEQIVEQVQVELSDEEKDELRKRLEMELAEGVKTALTEQLKEQVMNELRNELKDEMADEVLIGLEEEARSKIEAEMAAQREQLDTDKKLLIAEREQIRIDHQKQLDANLAAQREQFESDQKALVAEREQIRVDQQNQLDESLAASFSPGIDEIAKVEEKETSGKRISELEAENANLREIVQELEAELEGERNRATAERERTTSVEQVEAVKHAKLVGQMEGSLSELERLNEEKQSQIDQYQIELSQLKTELDLMKSEPSASVSSTTANNEIANMTHEEYDDLKKDQDDLLELLSDQQVKIGDYRARLKAASLSVTDDEDLEDI